MRSCCYGSQCGDGGVLGEGWERARARSDLRAAKMIFLEIGLAWCRTMAFVTLRTLELWHVILCDVTGTWYSQLSFPCPEVVSSSDREIKNLEFQDLKNLNRGLGVLV